MNDHFEKCPFCRGLHWHKYQYLENKLSNISRFITIDPKNAHAWGEEVADLLVLTGNAMDTFFKDMTNCPAIQSSTSYRTQITNLMKLKKSKKIEKDLKKENEVRKFLSMTHYPLFFESYYELSENEINVEFGLGKAQKLRPFLSFSDNKPPSWWTAYNDTKHEFYEKMENANLGNLLDCLGGLYILNHLHLCNKIYLGFHRFIQSPLARPYLVHELLRSRIGVPNNLEASIRGEKSTVFSFSYREENLDKDSLPLIDDDVYFTKQTNLYYESLF